MAGDSLDLCRRAYELYGRGEFDDMLDLFSEDVEVYVGPPNIESGTYRGRQTYRELIERWGGSWSEMVIEPQSMKLVGEWVLAQVEYHGRTRDGDLEVRQQSWELSLWRDGQVQRYEVYWDAAQGRAAFAERESASARPNLKGSAGSPTSTGDARATGPSVS
jgi:ketosteroid isomerase-like protein